MTHTFVLIGLAATMFAVTACNAEKKGDGTIGEGESSKVVAVPKGGDWTKIVNETPEGGFVMGNPDAKTKLVEFGSMTCPHCRAFDEEAMKPLTEKYVKSGQVSFEFRNFVRDGYDLAASIVARCGGRSSFFGLTRQLYADQPNWVAKIQAANPAQMQAIAELPPNQQLTEVAKLAGFPQWAAMRGIPVARTEACLANPDAPTRLVEMQTDAAGRYNVPGTPAFLLDGKMLDIKPGASPWKQVEAQLKAQMGQ